MERQASSSWSASMQDNPRSGAGGRQDRGRPATGGTGEGEAHEGAKRKRAPDTNPEPLVAVEERFELSEGVALTRFRGVLLRPLGHSTNITRPQASLPDHNGKTIPACESNTFSKATCLLCHRTQTPHPQPGFLQRKPAKRRTTRRGRAGTENHPRSSRMTARRNGRAAIRSAVHAPKRSPTAAASHSHRRRYRCRACNRDNHDRGRW